MLEEQLRLSEGTSGTKKRRLTYVWEEPRCCSPSGEGITGAISLGSISVPYTTVDISVSSSA